jgi:hypothetical protein
VEEVLRRKGTVPCVLFLHFLRKLISLRCVLCYNSNIIASYVVAEVSDIDTKKLTIQAESLTCYFLNKPKFHMINLGIKQTKVWRIYNA